MVAKNKLPEAETKLSCKLKFAAKLVIFCAKSFETVTASANKVVSVLVEPVRTEPSWELGFNTGDGEIDEATMVKGLLGFELGFLI